MRSFKYLFLVIIFASCKGKNKTVADSTKIDTTAVVEKNSVSQSFKSYKLYNDFLVTDTGSFSNGPMGGIFAIIKKDGIADTIDRGYGIKKFGENLYFFEALNHVPGDFEDTKDFLSLDLGDYILINNGKRTPLNTVISNFDNYFSSPEAINGRIYFWQLERLDSVGTIKVFAAEYNPLTNKTTNHYLMDDVLETDDANYFQRPYIKNGFINFFFNDKKNWKYNKDFK